MARTDNLKANYYATNILPCPRLFVPGERLRILEGKPARHHTSRGQRGQEGQKSGLPGGGHFGYMKGSVSFLTSQQPQAAIPSEQYLGVWHQGDAAPHICAWGPAAASADCWRAAAIPAAGTVPFSSRALQVQCLSQHTQTHPNTQHIQSRSH